MVLCGTKLALWWMGVDGFGWDGIGSGWMGWYGIGWDVDGVCRGGPRKEATDGKVVATGTYGVDMSCFSLFNSCWSLAAILRVLGANGRMLWNRRLAGSCCTVDKSLKNAM